MTSLKFFSRSLTISLLVCYTLSHSIDLKAQSYSFNWQELQLTWPVRFDPSVLPIYANSNPYLYPLRYTLLKTDNTDYKGGTGGHNGIDIGLNSFRPTDNNGAKIYAAAKGVLVAYRDGIPDRTTGGIAWDKIVPADKTTVTNLAPTHTGFNIQTTVDGSGNVIYLQHDNGFVTQYAHLKQGLAVLEKYKLGDVVPEGALLGVMASSGSSSGSHLHFGVYSGPQSTKAGVSIPSSNRIFKGYVATPWGYFVCPFYEETVQGKVKNMWKGPYPEVYKPLENGNLEVIDLALAATPFNSVTPPPNVSAVPQGYPLYVAPYISGAKGTYTIQIKSNTETISFGNGSDTLKAGVVFNPGQTISSSNGNFQARLQPNGQLGIWDRGSANPRWTSTPPKSVIPNAQYYLRLNATGTLCVYVKRPVQDSVIWCSDMTMGTGSFYAVLQSDGNFCVYKNPREYRWCSFSSSNDRTLTSNITQLKDLPVGEYTLSVFRQVPGDLAPVLRAQSNFSIFQGAKLEKSTLQASSDNVVAGQLTAGDFYSASNAVDKQTQFTVYLPKPAPPRPLPQFAILSVPITGITGLNPFEGQWGASMQLKASVNGKPIAAFSPVTTVNGVAKAVIFNPSELFNPGTYGLAAWPVNGLPITIAFEVPHNYNKQSDYLSFGAVTFEYYYQTTTTGLHDLDQTLIQDVQLFPNPAAETVQVAFSLAESTEVQVEVYDLLGRLQAPGLQQKMAAGKQQIPLNVQPLPVGIYWVQLRAGGSKGVQKLVLER